MSKEKTETLLHFLENYGESPSVQNSDAAIFDSQIKNLSLPLTQEISRSPSGTILDIGCGAGILLKRLVGILPFVERKWTYFAIDHDENIEETLKLAVELRVHRRVEVKSLEHFYTEWPTEDVAPRPYVGIIRNVFHELDIDLTSKLIHYLAEHLQADEVVIIQDLQVFPISERGNACWTFFNFDRLLKTCGFSTFSVDEPSRSGSRWFTILAKRTNDAALSHERVRKLVLQERIKQYTYWKDLGWLAPDDDRFRDVRVAKIDFDLQCAALQQQIEKAQPGVIPALTKEQEVLIAKKTFEKQLQAIDIESLSKSLTFIRKPESFRNRANHQDWLEKFLRDDSSLAVLSGGALTGKTTLVQQVLAHRSHDKQAIMIDIQYTSNVWNLIEYLFTSIGCKFSYELISRLRNFSFNDIRNALEILINGIGRKIILSLDHFERLLSPSGDVLDNEIQEFLKIIVNAPYSKLIITTRRNPNLNFINTEKLAELAPSSLGRFPEGKHVENVLDDFVDRTKFGIDQYPANLLDAIDRHPHLTVLAAKIIRKEGKISLEDNEFLDLIRNQLRDELIRRIVDEKSQPLINILSLIRIAVPREMIEALAGADSVRAAEEASLIYNVFDPNRHDLYAGIGAFRKYRDFLEDNSSDELHEGKVNEKISTHQKIARWFERLYRQDNDPRWIRELYYHTLATAEPSQIDNLGVVYRSEIFWAGEYWFRELKKYKEALWAFSTTHKLGLKTVFTEMRLAACLMRIRDATREKEGEVLYQDLITRFPTYGGIRTSYIDSLLYLHRYGDALDRLIEYQLSRNESAWIAHEYGRVYLGLHDYRKAVEAFEIQLKLSQDAIVYDNLARAYHRLGESENVSRILTAGLRRHPRNNRLKLSYAAHLTLIGTPEALNEAYPILANLYKEYPSDGRVLQQYCKILNRLGQVDTAEKIWHEQKAKVPQKGYETPIKVSIFIEKKMWLEALKELENIPSDNEHLIGMKKKVYLMWAINEEDKEECKTIAKHGLTVQMDKALEGNVPLMITNARLARIAEDYIVFDQISKQIAKVNPKIADVLISEREELSYWDDDVFTISAP